jgi:hypothetical protein
MSKVEDKITERLQDNILMQFLGAENVERLRTEITDAIIQQVIRDLNDSYDFIISPDDIAGDMASEIIENVKESIRPKVEKALYEKTMAKLGLE